MEGVLIMDAREARNQIVKEFDYNDDAVWVRAQAFAAQMDDFIDSQKSDGLEFREVMEKLMILSLGYEAGGVVIQEALLSAFLTGRCAQHLISTGEWVFTGDVVTLEPVDLDKLWGSNHGE
jgi:hypothetical protein